MEMEKIFRFVDFMQSFKFLVISLQSLMDKNLASKNIVKEKRSMTVQ